MYNKIKTGLALLMLFCLPGLTSAQAESKTYMYDHVHMAVPEPEVAAQ